MAAPAAPTRDSIVDEGLEMAGYKNPSTNTTAPRTRAQTEWMEEIKNDIWTVAKDLKFLQSTNLFVITEGRGELSYPSDYSSDLSMQLLECTHYGVCQAGGTTTTAKLATDEDMSADYPVGKEIVVYLTADKSSAYSAFVTAFDASTKVATFFPAIAVSPDATYSYMIVDASKPIRERQVIRYDEMYRYTERGTPYNFYPLGDSTYGKFLLYPVPYWSDSVPRAIRQRYYVNVMTLDLSGTLMATLYQRWRNVFVQGIKAKALLNDDDKRGDNEEGKYWTKLRNMVSTETYGSNMSNLSAQLGDNSGISWG